LVIGLDASLTCTGVAGDGWVDYIRPRHLAGHPRLAYLVQEVTSFIKMADLVVIEGPSFGGGVKHRHEDLAGLRVMIRHACWRRSIPYAVVPPSCRALYAAGRGNASKGEVRTAVQERYGVLLEGPARYDMADALTLAAMGLHHLGHQAADVPAANARGLLGVAWPDTEGLAA
jgi:Holliday junction resolvasome RuvABC endonuclease subunit